MEAKKILLVEDDPNFGAVLKDYLMINDFDVTLAKNGMEGFEKRQISQLSGGQQQRIFLARALVQDAEIYFMDEPFQGVDAKTEKSIINILKKLRDEGKTVIVVHHDLQTVEEYFDYITFINVTVISTGKVKDIFNRENIEKTYKSQSFLELSAFGGD